MNFYTQKKLNNYAILILHDYSEFENRQFKSKKLTLCVDN